MNAIIDFFSDTLIMDWLYGREILQAFDTYFLAQSEANRVLILIGVTFLSVLGAVQVVRVVLKLTFFWLKAALLISLLYYLFVVLLGIDIWSLFQG